MCTVSTITMRFYNNAKELLYEVELMRCKIIEIATSSNIRLQTPRQTIAAVIVEITRWHRETYLYLGYLAYRSIINNKSGNDDIKLRNTAPLFVR